MAAAQNSLGNLFLGGICVAQDYSQAHRWYTLAADQGYADALLNLAGMFLHGLGMAPSYEQAVTLAKRARSLHARDADSFLQEIEKARQRAAPAR
jgi:TPR repeat protein